jgi:hypothetical protein
MYNLKHEYAREEVSCKICFKTLLIYKYENRKPKES